MLHLYLGFAYLYVLWRFVVPLPLSRGGRALLAVILLAASQYHLIQIWVFGTMFSPEMPRWAVLIAGWAFCSFVLLFVFVVLADVVGAVLAALRIHVAKPLMRPRSRIVVAVLAGTLAALGLSQATLVPNVRTVEVRIKNLPPELDRLRVVQLTDLHISKLFQAPWVAAVVARTNALHPDLIVVTGDLIDGTTTDRKPDVAPLAELKARLGIIGIPGNHEYYFHEPQWHAEFERLGIQMVLNEHLVIGEGSESLVIAGVTDEAATQFGMAGPDLNAALRGAPEMAPIILLKHRPAGAARSAQAGVALQLSGHTHGGMIKGLGQLGRFANEGFVSGAYQLGAMTLYTSNGAGLWNGFPIRLGVPAEITELILRVDSST